MRLACIGIGSNAIRMLSAAWDGAALAGAVRERRGTRLFSGLVSGRLTEESIRASVEAVSELAALARDTGAGELFLFATSAVRDAENGMDFVRRCEAATGVLPEIVTGEEEAFLSFYGCCPAGGRAAVIDIGGGSTELTLGEDGQPVRAVSLQLGAVRMARRAPIECAEDYERDKESALLAIREGAGALIADGGGRVFTGVGGTMTTLGAMLRGVPLFSREIEGMEASRGEVARWGRALAGMPMEARRQVVGLMPHRADIIPSGLAILEAAMEAFSLPALRLSQQGNMDGYLKRRFLER